MQNMAEFNISINKFLYKQLTEQGLFLKILAHYINNVPYASINSLYDKQTLF
jgi:hypothetical protein